MKIGFIGLGIMGEAMSSNIINKHNDEVYVFDTVREKVNNLSKIGAIPCQSSIELAKNCDIIITMVPKSEHSMFVYKGILESLDETKICIDMSTIDPSVSIDIANMVMAKGAKFADAPVVKSKPAAISGTLGIYVGSDEETYEAIKPILDYMGNNVIRMGNNGKGLVMKICHNTLVAQIQNGVNETITLAKKNGINIEDYAKAISYGGGQNFYLDSKTNSLKNEDYTTAFSIENMAKDLGICKTLAHECNLDMPGALVANEVYKKSIEMGYAKEDFSATIKVVNK